jgi:hypothetical protein
VTRQLMLALAALALAGVVVVAAWQAPRTPEATAPAAAASEQAQPALSTNAAVYELSAPVSGAALETPHGEQPDVGERVETPDPLDPVVALLRKSDPIRYGALSLEEARSITALDLGTAPITDSDLALLATLPALEDLRLSTRHLSPWALQREVNLDVVTVLTHVPSAGR